MTRGSVAGIIATFNQVDYVEEAVLGLAAQVDELIVVDDCSSDGTWERLQSLAVPNLRALRNEAQSGVSATYNRAARETECEVLLIQGGDDRSLPGRARAQAQALADPGVALVFSLPIVIDATGARLPEALGGEFLVGRSDPDPLQFLYFEANYVCAPAAAVRRADYLELGGFRRGIDLLQDYELWLLLAARGSFVRLEDPVVEYRKHGTNTSREYNALDAPKQRRLAAEMGNVRLGFLRNADEPLRRRLASLSGLDPVAFAALARDDQVTLLQLSHPDRLVVGRGLDTLFDIVGAGDDDRLIALGLDYSDLARFSTLADPNNVEGIARALGAARLLQPGNTP